MFALEKKNIMGSSSSRNISQNFMTAISKVATNLINKTTLSTDSTQLIYVEGTGGNVNISGVNQKMTATINVSGLMKSMTSQESQTSLASMLQQTAKSEASGINVFQFTSAVNEIDQTMKSVMDVVTNITQECASNNVNSQKIEVVNTNGNVTLSDVSQQTVTNIISSCIYDAVSSQTAVTDLTSTISQSATALSKGTDLNGLAWAAVVFALVETLALFAPLIVGEAAITFIIGKLIGIIGILVGLGFIIYFLITYNNHTTNMVLTPYSKLIGSFGECSSVVLSTSTTYASATAASSACESNGSAVGFDWNSVKVNDDGSVSLLPEPITTFYSSISDGCKSAVNSQPDLQKVLYEPSFVAQPTDPNKIGANGDVWINTTNLHYWFYMSGEGWVSQSETLSKNAVSSAVTLHISNSTASGGNSGDYWLNTNNASSLIVSLKSGDTWNTINTVAGPGYATRSKCSQTTATATATSASASTATATAAAASAGTGSSNTCMNVSGFKVKHYTRRWWVLGVGIAILVISGVGTYWANKKANAAKAKKGKLGGASPASKPVSSPVSKLISSPASNPVATPVSNPASSPVASPASSPVATPVSNPVASPASNP